MGVKGPATVLVTTTRTSFVGPRSWGEGWPVTTTPRGVQVAKRVARPASPTKARMVWIAVGLSSRAVRNSSRAPSLEEGSGGGDPRGELGSGGDDPRWGNRRNVGDLEMLVSGKHVVLEVLGEGLVGGGGGREGGESEARRVGGSSLRYLHLGAARSQRRRATCCTRASLEIVIYPNWDRDAIRAHTAKIINYRSGLCNLKAKLLNPMI